MEANRLLREYKENNETIASLIEQYKEEIERLTLIKDAKIQGLEDRNAVILEEISGSLEHEGKRKGVYLEGTVYKRKTPDKYIYHDELLEELENKGYENYLQVKKSLNKMALKNELIWKDGKAYTPEGEEIEGLHIEDGSEIWVVK